MFSWEEMCYYPLSEWIWDCGKCKDLVLYLILWSLLLFTSSLFSLHLFLILFLMMSLKRHCDPSHALNNRHQMRLSDIHAHTDISLASYFHRVKNLEMQKEWAREVCKTLRNSTEQLHKSAEEGHYSNLSAFSFFLLLTIYFKFNIQVLYWRVCFAYDVTWIEASAVRNKTK